MKYSPSLDIQQCDSEGKCKDNIVNVSYDTLNSKLYSKRTCNTAACGVFQSKVTNQSLRKRLSVLRENSNYRISIDPNTLTHVIDSAVHASSYFLLQ
jgi:formate dehydrogenase assembly factor FdhD